MRKLLKSGCKSFMLFEDNITGARKGKVVNLKKIKEICKETGVFLFTCIHPETMLNKTSSEIQFMMGEWIKEISKGGGHAFYTSILANTPYKNIKAYVDSIKNWSFSDINE
jgi:hypothetical protein